MRTIARLKSVKRKASGLKNRKVKVNSVKEDKSLLAGSNFKVSVCDETFVEPSLEEILQSGLKGTLLVEELQKYNKSGFLGVSKCLAIPDSVVPKEYDAIKLVFTGVIEVFPEVGLMFKNFVHGKRQEIGRSINRGGYKTFANVGRDGKKTIVVSRIIKQVVDGPVPEIMIVHHKDHIKTNNSIDNLAFSTQSAHIQESSDRPEVKDALSKGRKGIKHSNRAFTDTEADEIRRMHYEGGFTGADIAIIKNVHSSTICNIIRNDDHYITPKDSRKPPKRTPSPVTKIADLKGTPEQVARDSWWLQQVRADNARVPKEGGGIYNVKTKNWLQGGVSKGYRYISLINDKGEFIAIAEHRLVHLVWIGPIGEKEVIDHKDLNTLNNHIDNIRAVTRSDNTQLAYDTGCYDKEQKAFSGRGEKCYASKLTEEKVIEIKVLLAQGETHRKIAKQYGVSISTIGYIASGKLWPDVGTKPSNLCSNCDHVNEHVTIQDRFWTCTSCGINHERAENNRKNTARFPIIMSKPYCKLTEDKVILMRFLYATTNPNYSSLGRQFNVKCMTAKRAIDGVTWSEVGKVSSDVCSVCGTKNNLCHYANKVEFMCSCCHTHHIKTDNNAKNYQQYDEYKAAKGRLIAPDEYLLLIQTDYTAKQQPALPKPTQAKQYRQPKGGKVKGIKRPTSQTLTQLFQLSKKSKSPQDEVSNT